MKNDQTVDTDDRKAAEIDPVNDAMSKSQVIDRELQDLAREDLNKVEEEVQLQNLHKTYKLSISVLRERLAEIKSEISANVAAANPPLTGEELAEQDQAAKDAEALAKEPCIPKIWERDFGLTNYIANSKLARSILLSHGALKLHKTMAFFFTGDSSSGKSTVGEKGSNFLPPEKVLNVTSLSEQAFYYMPDIKGKLLIFGETPPAPDGRDDYKQMALRQLISEDKIIRFTVEKHDGAMVGVQKVTEGPAVLYFTSTSQQSDYNDELANRSSWVSVDASSETTEAVMMSQAALAKNPNLFDQKALKRAQLKWQQFHRNLRSYRVIIPYAQMILPKSRHVTVRRLFALLLDYIKISALLHQGVREFEVDGSGERFLKAKPDDYIFAFELLSEHAPKVLEVVSVPAMKAFQKLKLELLKGRMSTGQIQSMMSEPESTVRRWLKELERAGMIQTDGKQGQQNLYAIGIELTDKQNTQDLGLVKPERLIQLIAAQSAAQSVNPCTDEGYGQLLNCSPLLGSN